MDYPIEVGFNPKFPTLMHIDLNSCFATVEQQANPALRGKPMAVAAFKSPGGCILAASVEAKRYGIKTGMRVKDGKELYPDLIIVEPDPWKYRNVHLALKNLLGSYSDNVDPKSIDEFVLDLQSYLTYRLTLEKDTTVPQKLDQAIELLRTVGNEIKQRIKFEVGEWLTVSIGMSTNRYLAKIASSLRKPDGLDFIHHENYLNVFGRLELTDLTGIKERNALRLSKQGIGTVMEFYEATPMMLQQAFHAVTGHYWYMRLRGWEVDDQPTRRRSYGNSVALGKNLRTSDELSPVLCHLVEKMSARMRHAGYSARGVHLSLAYKGNGQGWYGGYWHKGMTLDRNVFVSADIYRVAHSLLIKAPHVTPVHTIAVTCFDLQTEDHVQLDLLSHTLKKRHLAQAQDQINDKWGKLVITTARMLPQRGVVKDRIAFGGVKELEEIIL
jgi:DNA polymerase IV